MKAAAHSRLEREAKLHAAVAHMIRRYKLQPEIGEKLFAVLSERPATVARRELQILPPTSDPDALLPLVTLDPETIAALYQASKWTVGQFLEDRLDPPATTARWENLSRKERDGARKLAHRVVTKRWPFRRGRPPYPYTDLVRYFVERIETAAGKHFRFSRPAGIDEPGGPMMAVLLAALDLALFASGAPKPETLAKLIQLKHRNRR